MISKTSTSELIPTPSPSATAPPRGASAIYDSIPERWPPVTLENDTSLKPREDDLFTRYLLITRLGDRNKLELYATLLFDAVMHSGSEAFDDLFEASSLPTEVRNPVIWSRASERLRALIRDCDDESFEDGVKGRFGEAWRIFYPGTVSSR
jgi:hypothetical protein